MNLEEFSRDINNLSRNKVPYLFIIDYEMSKPLIYRLDQLPEDIFFEFNGITNRPRINECLLDKRIIDKIYPSSFSAYKKKFDKMMEELKYGNTFLINLTEKTRISLKRELADIYKYSKAEYKLFFKDQFVVFSPETFIKVKNGKIYTYPMKGTIDADIENAMQILLNDEKELAEHYTIVDLLRNDLSMVASKVRVEEFRYFTLIESSGKNLWQTSSEVVGELTENYLDNFGDLILRLLPAGSISGAPKKKTDEIISRVEGEKRGYYTGIMGLFDGDSLDTAVMIRYIEKCENEYFYRSGCGITHMSKAKDEYQEMLDKIYVPIR